MYNINDIDEIMHMTLMLGIFSICLSVGMNIQNITISLLAGVILNIIWQFLFHGNYIDCMY